jgi:hypothetical protein
LRSARKSGSLITANSDGNGGQCVEAASQDGAVFIRDTANRDGAILATTATAWQAFTATLR